MRTGLTTAVGLAFLAFLGSACGGTTKKESSGTTAGASTTGGSTTGGTTGGTTTTGGNTTGGIVDAGPPAGSMCTDNDACASKICGTNGTGNCCSIACNTSDGGCGAVGCDSTGTCVYPAEDAGAIQCGGSCLKSAINTYYCDTSGGCTISTGQFVTCPDNFGCNAGPDAGLDAGPAGTACNTTCTTLADCAQGFTCVGGACIPQIAVGPCSDNDTCLSLACGVDAGPGDCCTAACTPTVQQACNATGCNAQTGACIYPSGTSCGSQTCVNSAVAGSGICDSSGKCVTNPVPCPNHLGCDTAGVDCNTSCTNVTDCAKDYYCDNDAGGCIPQTVFGPCTANEQCTSELCGLSGTGNCCNVACPSSSTTCAASDCLATNGDCGYPDGSLPCGSTLESCAAGAQQDPSVCDGMGDCPTPGVTQCTPFICGANACLTTCTDATSCVSGAFCDTADSSCCAAGGLVKGGTITVDAATGSDATACCGFGTSGACLTISHAMKLIDNAQIPNVTINASIMGGGGNWTPKGEVYPIVLGWGVELSAGNLYIYDPTGGNAEIFDIANYSANDTVGSASIVGGAKAPAWIGMNSGDSTQSSDSSAIQVEKGNTLYIANASVNGSAVKQTNAITVVAGGTLTLGQDSSAAITGLVTIGNSADAPATDGWNGIVCTTANGLGCTITDATLKKGSSVVIDGQENLDIDAEDFANITLTSAPTIGVAPSSAGFGNCSGKPDAIASAGMGEAVLLNGDVTMTYSNGTVQCISGAGLLMQASSNGTPTLTMDKTTIQNTEYALYATAGKATISNSTVQYNYNGVEEGTDGTNSAAIDLSGGTVGGTNTVVCSNSVESINYQNGGLTPAVCVLDTTTANLNASNVDWDTAGPDEFSCDATLTSCDCELAPGPCTNPGGVDGMDAVYESSGTVTTTGNAKSKADCSFPCGNAFDGYIQCTTGQICCVPFIDFPCCTTSVQDCEDFVGCQ